MALMIYKFVTGEEEIMNKKEFLKKLRKMLNNLPRREIEERISFYSEMIDDRIEEGNTEKDAAILIGSVDLFMHENYEGLICSY